MKVLEDEVGGLLRVVELFESRKPKGQAIVTEFKGVVADIESKGMRRVIIHVEQPVKSDSTAGLLNETIAETVNMGDGDPIPAGTEINDKIIRRLRDAKIESIKVRRAHLVPYRGQLQIQVGQFVEPGDRLTEGPLDPQKVLELQGVRGVQQYVVREIQRVYKSQGVDINDKHVEVIVRQMLKKRKIKNQGDTEFLPGQVVDKFDFEDENARVRQMDPPGTESTSDWLLLGITEASLATESFLAAASFQKTTRVLTEAAVRGKKDNLVGLKENVIIGRLIPAGTGLPQYRNISVDLKGLDGSHGGIAIARPEVAPDAFEGAGQIAASVVGVNDNLSDEERDLLTRLTEIGDVNIDSGGDGAI
jgi:DNA-directed RNA polymerase subunit beta'